MAILHRICRLFAADMHGILDSLEAPDVMLRHAIREMEEAIAEKELEAKNIADCEKQVQKAIDTRRATHGEQGERIALCFAEGSDDLARSFVRRQLETERVIAELEEKAVSLKERREVIAAEIEHAAQALAEVQEKATLLQAASTATAASGNSDYRSVSDEEVEVAFLRAKRAARGDFGASGASQEVGS